MVANDPELSSGEHEGGTVRFLRRAIAGVVLYLGRVFSRLNKDWVRGYTECFFDSMNECGILTEGFFNDGHLELGLLLLLIAGTDMGRRRHELRMIEVR